MRIINYLRALYKGELFTKVMYFLKKKTGYFNKYCKKELNEINSFSLCNLNLIDLAVLNNEEDFEFDEYDFLGNIKKIDEIIFDNQYKEIFVKERLSNYGDIKELWEINRLQFLLPLSINCYLSKDVQKIERIKKYICQWKQENPFNIGPNWNSNLEVAIRAMTLYFIYEILDLSELHDLLYLHGVHLFKEIDYSDKCIPNNHVLGEAVALLVLGTSFKIDKWIKKAEKLILKYQNKIMTKEMISKEGSTRYHLFVTQMWVIVKKLMGNKINSLDKALRFCGAMVKPNGELLNIGDDDGGCYYAFYPNKTAHNLLKQFELFGYRVENVNIDETFYMVHIVKKGMNYLSVKVRQDKYHSHLDAFSFTYMLDGKDVICDGGTYKYNNFKDRNLYRSQAMHSTIITKNSFLTLVGTFRLVGSYSIKYEIGNKQIRVYKDKLFSRTISFNDDLSKIDIQDEKLSGDILEIQWIVPKYEDTNIFDYYFDINVNLLKEDCCLSKEYNKFELGTRLVYKREFDLLEYSIRKKEVI